LYCILDIEGDGAPFRKESIIEIAVYRFDGHRIVDQFISLVNPEGPITPFVRKLTGITEKMVKTAPKFHELARRIVEITDGAVLVGHNVEFDYRMLRQSFRRLGYDYEKETLDTIELARKLLPGEPSYSLGKLCKSIGVPMTEHHRAAGDARATLDLFRLMMAKDSDKEILSARREQNSVDNYAVRSRRLIEDLPADSGLIYFHDAKGKILYFDYVDGIYRAAQKIFASGNKRWEKLQNNTARITYEFTGTRLIAELMMYAKGKKMQKRYPVGLYLNGDRYFLERTAARKDDEPLMRFRTFNQGKRLLEVIRERELPPDFFNAKDGLFIGEGRNIGEKSFLVVDEGQLLGCGYFELHHQILSRDKVSRLMIQVNSAPDFFIDEMKMSLVKGELQRQPLPDK